jgi:hypothetical protein
MSFRHLDTPDTFPSREGDMQGIAHRVHEPPVGRDSVEPTFERSEANAVSVLRKPCSRDARYARTAAGGGKIGSTEGTVSSLGLHFGLIAWVTLLGHYALEN